MLSVKRRPDSLGEMLVKVKCDSDENGQLVSLTFSHKVHEGHAGGHNWWFGQVKQAHPYSHRSSVKDNASQIAKRATKPFEMPGDGRNFHDFIGWPGSYDAWS